MSSTQPLTQIPDGKSVGAQRMAHVKPHKTDALGTLQREQHTMPPTAVPPSMPPPLFAASTAPSNPVVDVACGVARPPQQSAIVLAKLPTSIRGRITLLAPFQLTSAYSTILSHPEAIKESLSE